MNGIKNYTNSQNFTGIVILSFKKVYFFSSILIFTLYYSCGRVGTVDTEEQWTTSKFDRIYTIKSTYKSSNCGRLKNF